MKLYLKKGGGGRNDKANVSDVTLFRLKPEAIPLAYSRSWSGKSILIYGSGLIYLIM